VSEAMDIPSLATPDPASAMAIQDKKLANDATMQRIQNNLPVWGGPSWPIAGSQAMPSMGMAMAMASSPYNKFMEPFGRSMDMTDAGSHFLGSGPTPTPSSWKPEPAFGICKGLALHIECIPRLRTHCLAVPH
jgi:hypothetical protein